MDMEGMEGIDDECNFYRNSDILDPGPLQCEQSQMRDTEIKIEDFDKKYRVSGMEV